MFYKFINNWLILFFLYSSTVFSSVVHFWPESNSDPKHNINIAEIYDHDAQYDRFKPILQKIADRVFAEYLENPAEDNFITNMNRIIRDNSKHYCEKNLETIAINFYLPGHELDNQSLKKALIGQPHNFNPSNFLSDICKSNHTYYLTRLYLAKIKRDQLSEIKLECNDNANYTVIKNLGYEIQQHFNDACSALNVNSVLNRHLMDGPAELGKDLLKKILTIEINNEG